MLTSDESVLMRFGRVLAKRGVLDPVRRAFRKLAPGTCRPPIDPLGREAFGVYEGISESAWPARLRRPVTASLHAFVTVEEDAWAVQLAKRLSARSPPPMLSRRARRRRKKGKAGRPGASSGCVLAPC